MESIKESSDQFIVLTPRQKLTQFSPRALTQDKLETFLIFSAAKHLQTDTVLKR